MDAYIYSIIDKKQLAELIDSFYYSINLPIQLLDENGSVLEQRGDRADYCRKFTSLQCTQDTCLEIHTTAGKRAMALGESYIFSCHSNLSHIVFPLVNQKTLFGSVLIGPFLMDDPDSTMILDVGKRYSAFSMEDLMELYDLAKYLPIVEPSRVTHISRLLFYLFSGLLNDAKEQFIINQKKLHQQAKINESIQMYKTLYPSPTQEYPIEKEQELIIKVKAGDLNSSRAILNDLLGYLFLSTGNSFDVVKNRSIELCSLLSRTAMESGATPNQILQINNHYLQNLQTYNTVEDLCYALGEILNTFIDCMFPGNVANNNHLIRSAMEYISTHFSEAVTLQDVADYVHLNAAYFSRIFKQASGVSFKEYLTMIRVEECKRLLRNTNYSLLDIAVSTGFEDQSYFSRVFKKYTGLTPKQFRG